MSVSLSCRRFRTIAVGVRTLLPVWLLLAPPAAAQYSVPPAAADSVSSGRVGSARQKVKEGLVRESGWELGASLNFITADESLGGQTLEFTDLMLLRVHALVSLGGRVELFGAPTSCPNSRATRTSSSGKEPCSELVSP